MADLDDMAAAPRPRCAPLAGTTSSKKPAMGISGRLAKRLEARTRRRASDRAACVDAATWSPAAACARAPLYTSQLGNGASTSVSCCTASACAFQPAPASPVRCRCVAARRPVAQGDGLGARRRCAATRPRPGAGRAISAARGAVDFPTHGGPSAIADALGAAQLGRVRRQPGAARGVRDAARDAAQAPTCSPPQIRGRAATSPGSCWPTSRAPATAAAAVDHHRMLVRLPGPGARAARAAAPAAAAGPLVRHHRRLRQGARSVVVLYEATDAGFRRESFSRPVHRPHRPRRRGRGAARRARIERAGQAARPDERLRPSARNPEPD